MRFSFLIFGVIVLMWPAFSLQGQSVYPFREHGKWGFMDEMGEIAIEPQFDFAGRFSGGFAMVSKNGLKTFINLNGELLGAPRFRDVFPFCQGFARVKTDSLWNFIDSQGQVLSDKGFEKCGDFSEGLAVVMRKGKYGYLNRRGEVSLNFVFDDADPFRHSVARVKKDGLYWFIDHQGQKLSRKYEEAGSVMPGGNIIDFRDGYWSVVDTSFHLLWKEDFEYYSNVWPKQDSACAFGLFAAIEGDKIDLDYCRKSWENPGYVRFRDSAVFQGDTLRYTLKLSPLPANKFHLGLMAEKPGLKLGFFVKGMGGRHQVSYRHSDILQTHTFTPAYYELSVIVLKPAANEDCQEPEEAGILKTYRLFPRSPFH